MSANNRRNGDVYLRMAASRRSRLSGSPKQAAASRATPRESLVMRKVRFPIAGLMGAVLVIALSLAALRNASETWAGATFLLTCAVLTLAVVGAVCRRDAERAWWLGFALFGWGYILLAFWTSFELPTMALLDAIGSRLGAKVQFGGDRNTMGGGMGGIGGMRSAGLQVSGVLAGGMGGGTGGPPDRSIQQIGHCLWALLAALVGGTLSVLLFGGRAKSAEESDAATATPATRPASWRRWLFWPALLGLSGCALVLSLVAFLSRSAPDFWAGASFLATCGLIGLTILGAAGEHGRRRQVWLGAALFGAGYMTLAFARYADADWAPRLPTEQLLHAVRGWLPSGSGGMPASWSGTAAANLRIWQALEQPVPMHFPIETPLEDILKYVESATRGPDGKGIPIYSDPIGLSEAEKTMTSVAKIDLDGVPLKTSLRLCLAQLDLAYSIRDGVLLITSVESAQTPVYQDPFLIAGHSLLALLAAGFGALVAPLVPSMRRERATPPHAPGA